jgi:membrane protein
VTEALKEAQKQFKSMPFKEWGKRLVKQIQKDDVPGLSAEIAYHWIFAIPPFLILIVMMGALLDEVAAVNVVDQLRTQINDRAPDDMQEVLHRLVDNAVAEVSGGWASFGILTSAAIALWSGSNGMNAFIKAFNRAYNVEEGRPYPRKRLVAVGLAVMVAALFNAAFLLLVYGERIGVWLANQIGAGGAFETVWDLMRLPFALLGIILVLALLYYIGPNIQQKFQWISLGAIIATILWLLLVLGFGIYLRFADPGSAYGVLGGVIVLLFFLYLTGMVLLVGAEINAIAQREVHEDELEEKVPPEQSMKDDAKDLMPGKSSEQSSS